MWKKTRERAFTLVEVTIALALGVMVLGTITAVYASVVMDHRRVQVLAEMSRDGVFVGQLLGKELRQAGLGVRIPAGTSNADHTNTGYGSAAPQSFYAGLILGNTSQVGILADLPRPDSNYPAYGIIHSRPTGVGPVNQHVVMWHNENNGNCAPDTAPGSSCVTGNFSIFFPGENGCSAAGANDRTCPWGMRRVVPNERLQVFAGNGSWVHSAAATSTNAVAAGLYGVVALPLANSFDTGAWANVTAGDGPGGNVGVGWVTTLDRVFFWYDGATRTILRQQCAGDPDPSNANFPGPTDTGVPGSPRLTPAGGATLAPAQNVCTQPEIVARSVNAFTLTYWDQFNAAVAAPLNTALLKQSIRRIDYVVDFQATVKGRNLTHSVGGAVRIQNQ